MKLKSDHSNNKSSLIINNQNIVKVDVTLSDCFLSTRGFWNERVMATTAYANEYEFKMIINFSGSPTFN